ncbi:MAG: 7-carboxy-7-deazaguanine synthase QueE [Salibacteraceae bacterium]
MPNSFSKYTFEFPVMEHFYTIQGEGYNAGKASYFIRLGGCDVGCPWCDVKESWEQEGHEVLSISTLIEMVLEAGAKNVVITGGEPCMYNLKNLTDALRNAGCKTWLETSGSYEITGDWDWIVVSPKKRKEVLLSSLQRADELKVVAVRKPDLEWADGFVSRANPNAKLYLQPEWSREDEVLPAIINHVKKYGVWQISLQTHKYMSIP